MIHSTQRRLLLLPAHCSANLSVQVGLDDAVGPFATEAPK
jgi:hypothetical protein